MYGILLQHLFLCYSSCVQSIMGFLIGWSEHLFVSELNNDYFTGHNRTSVKSRLVLSFWYRLTRVVLEKGPLNGCVCVYWTNILKQFLSG